eukprot:2862305-Pyramimonas_sp.AAC.1
MCTLPAAWQRACTVCTSRRPHDNPGAGIFAVLRAHPPLLQKFVGTIVASGTCGSSRCLRFPWSHVVSQY